MEMVDHPEHYKMVGRKECIVEIEEKYGANIAYVFCLTNCYKYLYRKDLKGNPMMDKSKAVWYYNYSRGLQHKVFMNVKLCGLLGDIESLLLNADCTDNEGKQDCYE